MVDAAVQLSKRPTAEQREQLEADYFLWLYTLFPQAFMYGPRLVDLAPHHRELWDWIVSITPGAYTPPAVALWARGGGKSTHAELGCAYLGATGRRRYVLYVSETQAQADKHVADACRVPLFHPRPI
jgi:hypothetical protein